MTINQDQYNRLMDAIEALQADVKVLTNDKLVRDTLAEQETNQRADRRRNDDRRATFRLTTAAVVGGVIAAWGAPVVAHIVSTVFP